MLKAVLISFTILIFPIFINFNILGKKDFKRVFFGIYVYGIIPLFGGYLECGRNELIVHFANNRAVIFPYNKILGMRNKFKPLKDYHFIKVDYILDIGSENGSIIPFSVGCVVDYVTNIMKKYFYFNKPYLRLGGEINIYMGKSILDVYFSGIVVFNLLMVMFSFIKILTEKLYYAFGKRKKQN